MTDDVGFADKFNSMPKFVVSTTLQEAQWNNSTLITGNVAEELARFTIPSIERGVRAAAWAAVRRA